ncbi:MAG: NADH-quinone oxidoreductase subunit F, partial [Chloroflexi bacterium]|nr:NADH-quinone oxidoreductase subunit F [Chloroflexota bacterium]
MGKGITQMPKITSPEDLACLRQQVSEEQSKYTTTVIMCAGSGCQASGCLPVQRRLREELEQQGLSESVLVRTTGCHGFCEQGPLMVIEPGNILYVRLAPEDVTEIVSETIIGGRVLDRLLYTDPVSGERIVHEAEVPFYRAQDRVLLGQNKRINPLRIEDYIAIGGYTALVKALTMAPEQIIAEVRAAGLRGRGGGGFPTARKWETTRQAPGEPKYVICNADEGDPGAYMNRSLLEGNPHAILEGMLIGAYAIGASAGFVYVRTEYPLAVENTR